MKNNIIFERITKISTEELSLKIDDVNIKIIDIRPVEAYNGWKIDNEIRGGHIKNSVSLPFKWFNYIDWIEIVRSKKIFPKNNLIIYGYEKKQINKAANQFIKIGYKNVKIYTDFIDEWSSNKNLPMERLSRYNKLVSADWLNKLINNGSAPEYNNSKFLIFHSHYQNRASYEEGHIPKALDIDTNLLESSETWNIRSPEELKKVFEDLGITYDTTVILYGKFSNPDENDPFPGSSAGHLGAMRCAFIMMYAGVKDVRILNGGLQSWIDSGFNTTTKDYKKKTVKDFGVKIPSHPELVVNIYEAENILKDSYKNLVSVRSWKEYIGKTSGYNYISKKGRIPGSVFGNCGSNAYHMENYRNLDHTTREYGEIKKIWEEVGITKDKYNSFYCGTGWRGSEAFFNAWLMGWNNISVFDGGWFEWSNKGYNYESGIPKEEFKVKR